MTRKLFLFFSCLLLFVLPLFFWCFISSILSSSLLLFTLARSFPSLCAFVVEGKGLHEVLKVYWGYLIRNKAIVRVDCSKGEREKLGHKLGRDEERDNRGRTEVAIEGQWIEFAVEIVHIISLWTLSSPFIIYFFHLSMYYLPLFFFSNITGSSCSYKQLSEKMEWKLSPHYSICTVLTCPCHAWHHLIVLLLPNLVAQ